MGFVLLCYSQIYRYISLVVGPTVVIMCQLLACIPDLFPDWDVQQQLVHLWCEFAPCTCGWACLRKCGLLSDSAYLQPVCVCHLCFRERIFPRFTCQATQVLIRTYRWQREGVKIRQYTKPFYVLHHVSRLVSHLTPPSVIFSLIPLTKSPIYLSLVIFSLIHPIYLPIYRPLLLFSHSFLPFIDPFCYFLFHSPIHISHLSSILLFFSLNPLTTSPIYIRFLLFSVSFIVIFLIYLPFCYFLSHSLYILSDTACLQCS